MLKNIFQKSLFERRMMTFWWVAVSLIFVLSLVLLFPLFKDTFSVGEVSEQLRAFTGDANVFNTMTGWLSFQIFDQLVFIGIILGIIIGGSILAGDENEGTLGSLLSLPVRRARAYWQKFAAISVIVGAVSLCLFLGCWLGVLILGEAASTWDIFLATIMAYLAALFFTALTYAIGAITGRRGLAGMIAGLFAFISYMITSLAAGINALKIPDYFSPFHYYNKPSPFSAGFQWGDALVLVAASAIILAIGYWVFVKRDIYQR